MTEYTIVINHNGKPRYQETRKFSTPEKAMAYANKIFLHERYAEAIMLATDDKMYRRERHKNGLGMWEDVTWVLELQTRTIN